MVEPSMTRSRTMSRLEADTEIASLAASIDAISTSLLDLDNHPGYQTLQGHQQKGMTATEWAAVEPKLSLLWEDFGRLRSVLDQVRTIRGRRNKPSDDDLQELANWLRGEPVELETLPVPLARRTLTGPSFTITRIGVAGLMSRMNTAFEDAGDLFARVEAAVTAIGTGTAGLFDAVASLQSRILPDGDAPVGATGAAGVVSGGPGSAVLGAAVAGVGGRLTAGSGGSAAAALRGIRAALAELIDRSESDPLSLADPTAELAAIRNQIALVQQRITSFGELRRAWPAALSGARNAAAALAQTLQASRRARDAVIWTVRTALPAAQAMPAEINTSIAALQTIVDWPARMGALTKVMTSIQLAQTTADAELRLLEGLLERHAELSGRLSAFQAKAKRLGRMQDDPVTTQFQRATAALTARPCDLAAATREIGIFSELIRGEATAGNVR